MRSIHDVKSSLHVTSMPLLLGDTRVASPLAKRIVPLLHIARFLRARYSMSVPEYLFMLGLSVFLLTPSVHLLEHSSSSAVNLSERRPVRIHSRDRPIWSISVITLRLQNTGWRSEH